MTLAQLEAEIRSRTGSDLFALFAECRQVRHLWKELETDLVREGRHAHYCTRCLRAAVGGGVEFWPTLPASGLASRQNAVEPR